MCDAYPLLLFSYQNYVRYINADDIIEFIYRFPLALQAKVGRHPTLTQEWRLLKALFSFKLALHGFHFSFLPQAERVSHQ
jgi:hypothetical protein